MDRWTNSFNQLKHKNSELMHLRRTPTTNKQIAQYLMLITNMNSKHIKQKLSQIYQFIESIDVFVIVKKIKLVLQDLIDSQPQGWMLMSSTNVTHACDILCRW